MSYQERATIVFLALVVLIVWGMAVRAALWPDAQAEEEPVATPPVSDASSGEIAAGSSSETATRGSAEGTALVTPARLGQAEAWIAGDERAAAASPGPALATPAATGAMQTGATPTSALVSELITATQAATLVVSPTATVIPTRSLTVTVRATQALAYILPLLPTGTPTIPMAGRFLLVNQDRQVMHVYEDGVEVRTIPVSSGRPVANAFTPAWSGDVGRYWGSGPFLNTELWSDYMWYLFPGPRGSILIHSVPYTWDGSLKVYDQPEALGVAPVSHGCVRISPEDAQWLKDWNPVGVPIEIMPWSGEIGPPDESLGPGG